MRKAICILMVVLLCALSLPVAEWADVGSATAEESQLLVYGGEEIERGLALGFFEDDATDEIITFSQCKPTNKPVATAFFAGG